MSFSQGYICKEKFRHPNQFIISNSINCPLFIIFPSDNFFLPLYSGDRWGVGGYLESNPFGGIEFVSREITLRVKRASKPEQHIRKARRSRVSEHYKELLFVSHNRKPWDISTVTGQYYLKRIQIFKDLNINRWLIYKGFSRLWWTF